MKRKRLLLPASLVLALASLASPASASTFDPASGVLKLSPAGGSTLRGLGFEQPGELAPLKVRVATWSTQSFELVYSDATPEALSGLLTTEPEDALEGGRSLRLGKGGKGLVFFDQETFDKVKGGRFEVSFWGRSVGVSPTLSVAYGRTDEDIYKGGKFPFASVRVLRTGKQTTDGWAEFSTGPLEGQVFGVGARALVVVPRGAAEGDFFLLDALEIKKVEGARMEPKVCTQDDVDQTCGAEGDCMYGHCVPSSVTWGPLPSPSFREELAERWIHISGRIHGNRNSIPIARTKLAPEARRLAREARSARQFVGGLARLVNELRDNHTSFGSPTNFSFFGPQVNYGSSNGIACFGVVAKDLMGGGMGYGIFRAGSDPRFKPGDVLVSIDGQDPKAWIDKHFPSFAHTLPSDPRSDWGETANMMTELLVTRARTFTLARCAPNSTCTGADRAETKIDIGDLVYQAIVEGKTGSREDNFGCTARLTNAVPNFQSSNRSGEDIINVDTRADGEIAVQFDGFVGGGAWDASWSGVFKGGPPRVLVDARQGHGGYYSTVESLFRLTRGASEPIGVFSTGRGSYDDPDPAGFLTGLRTCTSSRNNDTRCFVANSNGFYASGADPEAMASKIAWVNTVDVSANDFMPKLLQGRSRLRIFAPHPTSGAFGSVISVPSFISGIQGGSIQIQDARFGSDFDAAQGARWESGHGVDPDQIVVQKQSDLLTGTDTLLTTARAWLNAP